MKEGSLPNVQVAGFARIRERRKWHEVRLSEVEGGRSLEVLGGEEGRVGKEGRSHEVRLSEV